MPSDYRLAPHVAARLLGTGLVLLGLLVAVTTALIVLFTWSIWLLAVVVIGGGLALLVAGSWLSTKAWVVRLTDDGYQVRLVRGAGVRRARWADVGEVVTDTVAGSPCLIMRLRDGGATTVPVEVLAGDREEFVREVGTHLIGR